MGNRDLLSMFVVASSLLVGCALEPGEEGQDLGAGEAAAGEVTQAASAPLASGLRAPRLDGLKLSPGEGALAPAPGITYFQSRFVASANSPTWENIGDYQSSTAIDHGGAWIDVAVLQYGYGNGNATLNGGGPSATATQNLCGPASSLHVCNVGETVTGFLFYYEYSNSTGGFFSAYSDSIASPFGRWTDTLTVR